MTIMTIDDSSTMRKIVSTILKADEYDVIEAENGKDALEKLNQKNQKKIHLFVVDINMPIMNGIEFITALRKMGEYCRVPVVILTTESEKDMIEKGRNAGANAWVIKPFESEDFLKIVKKLLG